MVAIANASNSTSTVDPDNIIYLQNFHDFVGINIEVVIGFVVVEVDLI
jgi:hypothetical protein